jgi:hypothetical protein
LKRRRKNLKTNQKHQIKTRLPREKEKELVNQEYPVKGIKIELLELVVQEVQGQEQGGQEVQEVVTIKEDQHP